MANNEVLAGLKRAYLATEDEQVRNGIIKAWAEETNEILAYQFMYDAKIRAWQTEQPDPIGELTKRVEDVALQTLNHSNWLTHLRNEVKSLQRSLATLSNSVQTLDAAIDELNTLESPQPAPVPDDPVCACGHPKTHHSVKSAGPNYGHWCECCKAFNPVRSTDVLPAPPAAPELDPYQERNAVLFAIADAWRRLGHAEDRDLDWSYQQAFSAIHPDPFNTADQLSERMTQYANRAFDKVVPS